MSKRFTDTRKYRKGLFRALQAPYKLLWDFLYHECDHAGIWDKDFELAQLLIGKDAPVDEATALKVFNDGEERVTAFKGGLKWFIRPFVQFQYNVPIEDLNPGNRVHASVISSLKKEGLWKPHASSLQGAKDKEKDKDKDKDKDRPTLEMVAAYCKERRNKVDPVKWFAYYESNGWRIGKNPMKSWKHAIWTWEKSEFNQPPVKQESESWIEKAAREAQEKAAARVVTP